MICPSCGASFEAMGIFCPHCGARMPNAATAPPNAPSPPPPGYGYAPPPPPYGLPPYAPATFRVQRNLQVLTVLWGCLAVYRLAAGLASTFFLRLMAHGGLFGHNFPFTSDQIPLFSALVPFAMVTTLALTGLSALVAYGMLHRRPWGRTLAIIMSIVSMLKFPLGTALGIYTLWVMAPAASAMEYDSIADRTRPGF